MRAQTVREIMSSAHLLTCGKDTSLSDAAKRMKEEDVGSIVVVERDRVVGIFTERDAVNRIVAAGLNSVTTPIEQVMTPNPDVISPDAPIADAIQKMDEAHYRHLPVVAGNRVVGVLSFRDLPIRDLAAMAQGIDTRKKAW